MTWETFACPTDSPFEDFFIGPTASLLEDALACPTDSPFEDFFIGPTASLLEDALACPTATLFEDALACPTASLFEDAFVCPTASLFEDAYIIPDYSLTLRSGVSRVSKGVLSASPEFTSFETGKSPPQDEADVCIWTIIIFSRFAV